MQHYVGRLDKAIKRSLAPSEFNRGIENVFREAKFGSHHFDLLIRVFEHFGMLDTSTLKLSHSTSESHSKLNYENMQRFLTGLPQLFEKAEEEWRTAEGEGDDFVEGEGNGLGEGDALCALGGMFEDGLVVVVDVQAAFDIYQRLSSRGHSTALCGVGWFYDLGGGVVEPDKQRAFHYYQLASDKGNLSAQRNVAILHSHEGIQEADPRKGIELYEDIITKTEGKMLNAVFSLAYCYDNGKGTAKDPRKAAALYKQAADHGHDRALVNLGVKYEYGDAGLVKDVDRAVDMYKRAALAGNAVGANNLAISYYNRKEHMDAANWYMTAFYLGNNDAKRQLVRIFGQGQGVAQDLAKAKQFGK